MQHRRHAFTLVELLVVLAVIAVLGGLVAYVLPGFRDSSRAAKGASALQGWLNYARQQAIRSQTPFGVRFMYHTQTYNTNPGPVSLVIVTECQYIEKPDDFSAGPIVADPTNASSVRSLKVTTDSSLMSGYDFSDGTVEAGDVLEIMGSGTVRSFAPNPAPDGKPNPRPSNASKPLIRDLFILNSDLPTTITAPIVNYRIMRRPRVTGDEALTLPAGVIIDINSMGAALNALGASQAGYIPTPVQTSAAPPAGYADVLFSPTGAVMGAAGDRAIFWVRTAPADLEPNNPLGGNPSLIVVYTNSGAAESYALAKGPNPYANVR